ncbi:hypothetical protein, partial [Bacillus anthracis]|uniref:hypothetical protein n=1 Tax=Bacillus anthracis TaxID=1392 RepID=UPI001C993FA9
GPCYVSSDRHPDGRAKSFTAQLVLCCLMEYLLEIIQQRKELDLDRNKKIKRFYLYFSNFKKLIL